MSKFRDAPLDFCEINWWREYVAYTMWVQSRLEHSVEDPVSREF